MSASITHASPLVHTENYTLNKSWSCNGGDDIVVDSSGNFYVPDSVNDSIQKFSQNGTLIKKWGSYGNGNGYFNGINGIAIDSSGNVYVADTRNGRIQKFDSNGKFITKFSGSGDGKLNEPGFIAIDSSGNIFVVDGDYYTEYITKFDRSGKYLTRWPSYTPLSPISGLAVDSKGNVYAAIRQDFGGQKNYLLEFNNTGTLIFRWGLNIPNIMTNGITVYDVAVDSSGNVYLAYEDPLDNSHITKFYKDGNLITDWACPGAYSVALDSSNNVYVNCGRSTIEKYTVKYGPGYVLYPVANFSSSVTKGYAPLDVQFNNLSKNTTNVIWDFGDSYPTTTYSNPEHTYTTTGLFKVVLTAYNDNGSNTKSIMINVTSKPILPIANFGSNITTGKTPLTVKFTDKSTGSPTSWSWKFGDGSTSTTQSLSHKYTKKGNYTVSLTVKNVAGSNTTTKSKYITVK